MPTTAEEIQELKAATREAHEAIRDLNYAVKRAREVQAELSNEVDKALTDGIGKQVQEGLDAYKASLEQAIDTATESIYSRFDAIGDMLLGEDKASKRAGKPSIPELVKQKVQIENHYSNEGDASV